MKLYIYRINGEEIEEKIAEVNEGNSGYLFNKGDYADIFPYGYINYSLIGKISGQGLNTIVFDKPSMEEAEKMFAERI